jgi:preprotein translocase subunit SecF
MRLLEQTPSFEFMGHRRAAMTVSAILILISLGSVLFRGMNFGIDFTGGLLLEVVYSGPAQIEDVRRVLTEQGFADALVQNFGTASDVLIRLPPVDDPEAGETLGTRIIDALRAEDPSVQLLRTEFVGPQVGEDLTEQGGLAMLFALIMIFGYVMLRFRWKFAAGAIAALVHDVIITIGFFSILQLGFDLTILAAVLAVIGYSLNDTIVVFDRIRENFRVMRRGNPDEIINASINQTLARTIITGLTTLLVLIGLAVLGGATVSGFAIALIVGILVGTYSSIYIASAAALELDVSPADLMPAKRAEELDELP